MLKVGSHSPWGPIQYIEQILPPHIVSVSTAGHGGFKVYDQLNKQIPEPMRCSDGWYEEDCDWSIPYVWFGDEIMQHARTLGAQEYARAVEHHACAVKSMSFWSARFGPLLKQHGKLFHTKIMAYRRVGTSKMCRVTASGHVHDPEVECLQFNDKGELIHNQFIFRDSVVDHVWEKFQGREQTGWFLTENDGKEYATEEEARGAITAAAN